MRKPTPEQAGRQHSDRTALTGHPQIFDRWRTRLDGARAVPRFDVGYDCGPSPAESLDRSPAEARHAPLLVFFHGGCRRSLDKRDAAFLAPSLVEAGVSVAHANHGPAGRATLEMMCGA